MHLLLFPFRLLWRLATGVVQLIGRTLSVLLGLLLIALGIAISATIVGAVIGIPLIALGFVFIWRGLF